MATYRVNLDIFCGPLDLLLYLVRKEEVDIYNIPIARITDQYLRYLQMLQSLDIDLASEFLVMAATLMEIKSAMLLPRTEPVELELQQATDPRQELIRQLLEYKRFKDAANLLQARADSHAARFPRPDVSLPDSDREARQIDLEQVSPWDLLEAFDAICRATGQMINLQAISDETPIDLYQIEILHRLQTEGPLTFKRLFEGKPNRLEMVMHFLALLELIRAGLVWAEQAQDGGEIYLRSLTDEPAEIVVPKVILAIGQTAEHAEQPGQAGGMGDGLPVPIEQVGPPAGHGRADNATVQVRVESEKGVDNEDHDCR
ncbi:MAG: segregation/condensation protein A [Sedimentisphaerales bacterium]|nr:segregation/condensation protein A [Sedimentisphaerales bacterium]